jgi:Zn-dependent membrane protease YugP
MGAGFLGFDMMYWVIGIGAMLVSQLVRWRFNATLKQLDQIQNQPNMTGAQIAEKMLRDYGVDEVRVISTRGRLTDHYNPADRTVNLSEAVYGRRSITAAAVAAHEVGHAVQHATGYSMLKLRSAIVPVVSLASRFSPILLMVGIGIAQATGNLMIMGLALVGFAASTLFALITLPVEFDASARALKWLERSGLSVGKDQELATRGLKWAAMTYVVAALTQLAYLLYYLQIFMRMQSNR